MTQNMMHYFIFQIIRIFMFVSFSLGSTASKLPQRHWQRLNTSLKLIQNVESDIKHPSCPPWKYKFHNSSCECGDSIHSIVRCSEDDNSVSILTCHCMSYSDHDGDTLLVGDCPYLCTNNFYIDIFDNF